MIIELTLPKLGESIVGATVVQWLKREGDRIAIDEPLLEVSTDKINSEIPSPAAGILKKILVHEAQEVEVGALLATIELVESSTTEESSPPSQIKPSHDFTQELSENADFYSPAVLRLAKLEGIGLETLRTISGTGEGGRVTKKDLEHYAEQKRAQKAPRCPFANEPSFIKEPSSVTTEEERIPMSGMRKAIAQNMVRSFYEAPHASLVIDADVTDVMKLIAREKERFFETHGVKLTITSFLIQALTKAVQQFPMLNASLEEETIVLKRYVNVGIAVNVEKGLVVPVIKNCQERNLVSLAKAISEISTKARDGKLSSQEVVDGSITLTNFGMTGALIGVPIIRFPEVAIIGAGTVQKRVVVREDDSFAVRQMMYLTLTFDHRVIDGIYGCQFLSTLKHLLESVAIH